jgi:hypothetical protein
MTDILAQIARSQNWVQIPHDRIARYKFIVEETNKLIAESASELISISRHGVEDESECRHTQRKVQP